MANAKPEPPEKVAPEEPASEEPTSETAASESTASEDTASEDTAPEDTASEDTAPEETAPEETVPAETVPAQVKAPANNKPARAVAPRHNMAVPEQCLTFTLGGDEYGVGILQLREIVEYETLTKVPSTPPWIRGVMNLRGTVVPVVDLAAKFGLPETEIAARTCIVIVEADLDGESTPMGVMVDTVVRVLDLSPENIEEPPTFGTRVHVDYLLGVGKVDDQLVLVLDINRVLSIDELLEVAATPDAAAADTATDDTAADDTAADDAAGSKTSPGTEHESMS